MSSKRSESLAAKVAMKDVALNAWEALTEWLAEDEARSLKVTEDGEELLLVVFEGDVVTTGKTALDLAGTLGLEIITKELMALIKVQLEEEEDG